MPIIEKRNPSGLIGAWAGGLLVAGIIYWLSRLAPAFEDLLNPIYWIIGVILVAFTIKWVRTRSAHDRRGGDRRRSSRREFP